MITVLAPSPALDVTYLVPRFATGGIHRPDVVTRLPGGKGFNLARAAITLGARASVIAPLGGRTGDLVAEGARAEGVELVVLPASEETRQCVSIVSEDSITAVYEHAAPTDLSALVRQVGTGRVVLSGSIPPPVAAIREIAGRDLAVDVHGPALAVAVEHGAGLVKVNRAEAAAMLGHDDSAVRLARAIADRTGGTAVVTDGAAGAAAVDAWGAWVADPDPEPGRFSVGSGDSFFAGLLVALDAGSSLDEALAQASAAGSANTRTMGAAQFLLADVAAARERIRVRAV